MPNPNGLHKMQNSAKAGPGLDLNRLHLWIGCVYKANRQLNLQHWIQILTMPKDPRVISPIDGGSDLKVRV